LDNNKPILILIIKKAWVFRVLEIFLLKFGNLSEMKNAMEVGGNPEKSFIKKRRKMINKSY